MVRGFLKSKLRSLSSLSIAFYLGILSIFSVLSYLLVSRVYFRIGFPLDDSWIHQTYARNLVVSGEWTFLPGETSGGSTSPLWTALLAIGYILKIPSFYWTFGMGVLILWGVAYLLEKSVRLWVVSYNPIIPWIGSLLIFEWHFVWAAVSGMETLLFSAMVLWVLFQLIPQHPRYFMLGIMIGICVWIRPDGLTLLGPVFMVAILENISYKKRIINIGKVIFGFGGLFSLYLLFSLALAGTPWPTTFYAKQAEYEILSNMFFFERLGKLSVQLFVGIGSILFPGYILIMEESIRKRKWGYLASFFWILGFLILYAWRLPVVYQHGRYVFPVMMVYISFSSIGMMDYLQHAYQGMRWVINKTWIIAIGLILIIFWGYGSVVYARDVAIIESEMVNSAHWVDMNLPDDSIIAAHDIGALGYFSNHKIVDLAGLITPEVIPFLRDEGQLAEFLDEENVDYLITFPGWFPELSLGLPVVFSTQGKFSPMFGGENMTIYLWQY